MPLRRIYRRQPLLVQLTGLCAILLLIVGALVIAVVAENRSKHAAEGNARTVACLNSVLAERDKLTAEQHANEAQKIADQKTAVADQDAAVQRLGHATSNADVASALAQYHQGEAEFDKALSDWQTRDNAIAAEQRAHPLGKC